MLLIGFFAQKGGAGKTTLTVQLAVLAGNALMVDLDSPRAAAKWWESCDAELAVGKALDLAGALATTKHTWVLIDTASHAAEDARTVAGLVDLVVGPTRPAILDLRAIRVTVAIVQVMEAKAVIVLNSCPPGLGIVDATVMTEALTAFATYGLPVAPIAIIQRTAMTYALNDGRVVTEFEPDGKAADESKILQRWVSEQARANATRRHRHRARWGQSSDRFRTRAYDNDLCSDALVARSVDRDAWFPSVLLNPMLARCAKGSALTSK